MNHPLMRTFGNRLDEGREMKKQICIVCQGTFTPKAGNQKTCSKECAEIAKRERNKTYCKSYQIMMARKTPQEKMALLNKHVREAEKRGLSYGQYMARMRMQGAKK